MNTDTGRADFQTRYDAALADPNVSSGLLSFQRDWKVVRNAQIDELQQLTRRSFGDLVDDLSLMKRLTREQWPALTSQFEANVIAAGGQVHHAVTAGSACAIVEQILSTAGATRVVKTKSMVTEEIFLNRHLESVGFEVVETDLGEWLIQLSHDHPSHLVLPVIHRRRHQIARILADELGHEFDPDDVQGMVRAARGALRSRFLAAHAGITGANALIASTGGILLITNEGNATLTTVIPDLHIVIAGLDKLVPDVTAALDQVRLLGRSATGQRITSFTNVTHSPRPGQQLHVVIVDNGRSAMAADPHFADALACIRCGACADVCPPYQVVGGHVFGHVYTGAIGLVNTPFHHGLEAIAQPQALCVSCNACTQACPAGIPLARQILRVRRRVFEQHASRTRRLALRAFRSPRLVGVAAALAAVATAPLRRGEHVRVPLPRRHRWRRVPAIPIRPARRRNLDQLDPTVTYESAVAGKDVALFMQCVSDRLAPDIVEATARLIAAAGGKVVVPAAQHCCGLPAFDAGDWDGARRMLRATLDTFEGFDLVVTTAPSCLAAIAHEYDELVEDDADLARQLATFRERLVDVAGFLDGPGRPPDGTAFTTPPGTVGVHRFCQCTNVLGRGDAIERILRRHTSTAPVDVFEADVCCGFGGSTSVAAPEVSAGIADRKLTAVEQARVDVLVADNPGCIIHLRAAIAARGGAIRVMHLAEYLTAGDATATDLLAPPGGAH